MKQPKQRILYNNYDYDLDFEIDELAWDDFKYEFENFINGKTFILQGMIGTWCGEMKGGFTFDSFNELYKAWNDCDYIKVYDENGHLYINCSHHDGTNFYEIRELTEKGIEYLNNHYYDNDREVHNKLMKSPYSVLPNYAHKVWGCKKREYETI